MNSIIILISVFFCGISVGMVVCFAIFDIKNRNRIMEKREPMKLEIVDNNITITTPTEIIKGIIAYDLYFFHIFDHDKKYIFKKANIRDIGKFHKEILGYAGIFFPYNEFPYCRGREDVIKLVKAIVDYNNNQLKGNLFLRKKKNIKFNFNL